MAFKLVQIDRVRGKMHQLLSRGCLKKATECIREVSFFSQGDAVFSHSLCVCISACIFAVRCARAKAPGSPPGWGACCS